MEPQIKFSADNSSAQVIFANGKETDFYTSQSEMIAALKEMKRAEKITAEQFTSFTQEILNNESMQWEDDSHGATISIEVHTILGGAGRKGDMMDTLSELFKFGSSKKKDHKNKAAKEASGARFVICSTCGKHGSVITEAGEESEGFTNIEDGIVITQALLADQKLSVEEASAVCGQIRESCLPKTKSDAMDSFFSIGNLGFSILELGSLFSRNKEKDDFERPQEIKDAVFVMSKDGRKGRIFTPDKYSISFYSKEEGIEMADAGVEQELFNDDIVVRLKTEIEASNLPATKEEVVKEKQPVS